MSSSVDNYGQSESIASYWRLSAVSDPFAPDSGQFSVVTSPSFSGIPVAQIAVSSEPQRPVSTASRCGVGQFTHTEKTKIEGAGETPCPREKTREATTVICSDFRRKCHRR